MRIFSDVVVYVGRSQLETMHAVYKALNQHKSSGDILAFNLTFGGLNGQDLW